MITVDTVDLKLKTVDLELDINLHKVLLDQTGAYIYIKNLKREYIYINEITQELFQKEREFIIGYDDSHFFELDALSDIINNDNWVLNLGKVVKDEEVNVRKGNKEVTVYQTVKKPIYNCANKIVGLLGISTDITEMYLLKEELKTLVFIDDLTQLNNRKSYNECIRRLLSEYQRYKTPFSMVIYDIDNFKQINDNYGHNIGDNVLIAMSALIKSHIRETDYIFRIGGEEFVILFTQTKIGKAKSVSEKIRESVENNLKVIKDKKITISIGVSEVKPEDKEDTLFKRVDDLLYKSKNIGKNKISYD